jgi:hypothetical protein
MPYDMDLETVEGERRAPDLDPAVNPGVSGGRLTRRLELAPARCRGMD